MARTELCIAGVDLSCLGVNYLVESCDCELFGLRFVIALRNSFNPNATLFRNPAFRYIYVFFTMQEELLQLTEILSANSHSHSLSANSYSLSLSVNSPIGTPHKVYEGLSRILSRPSYGRLESLR